MSHKINNVYGSVVIENDVIAKIAGLAAVECFGVVGMAAKNVRDGLFQLLKKESLTKGIRIKINEDSDKVSIDLHIVVQSGINITAVCDALINNVKFKVEEYVGIEVEEVNIYVEGLRAGS